MVVTQVSFTRADQRAFVGRRPAVITGLEYAPLHLNFPNPSRSFDESGSRIRFWGYDRAIEVSFFVECDALKRLCPGMGPAEAEFLKAFDETRKRIHAVANEIYVRGVRGKSAYSYVLSVDDF